MSGKFDMPLYGGKKRPGLKNPGTPPAGRPLSRLKSRKTLLPLLFLILTAAVGAEIIKTSRLQSERKNFSMKRDIFSPFKPREDNMGRPPVRVMPTPPPRQLDEEEKKQKEAAKIEAQVMQSVSFEGYVIKKSKSHALLSVNGEFFIAGLDDVIQEKIKILNINKQEVTIEVDSKKITIKLKGDDEDETSR